MDYNRNRIISLSAIFQASLLVQQLACTGKFEENNAIPLIESLFTLQADSIQDIYKNIVTLKPGLETFIRIFENNNRQNIDQDIARYVLSLIHLERGLIKQKDLLTIVKQGIINAEKQTHNLPITHNNIMANLSGVYTDTLSTLKFRIHITGEQIYLTNTNNINKIRTLLLAGVRAAVLWRQMKGNRWQLFFQRKLIINNAKILLNELGGSESFLNFV